MGNKRQVSLVKQQHFLCTVSLSHQFISYIVSWNSMTVSNYQEDNDRLRHHVACISECLTLLQGQEKKLHKGETTVEIE